MSKKVNMTIENRLVLEKRDMCVYHYSTQTAHMISYNSSIILPLRSTVENDYLHISIVRGPGNLASICVVNLPSWADFEFSSRGDVTVVHSSKRTLVKVPPGPPLWQLKITRSLSSYVNQRPDRVTICDGQQEYL